MATPDPYRGKWATLAAMCFGLGLLMMDLFIVTVALPAIGRDLQADLPAVEWTLTGYALMLGVLPVAMGRLGDLFGRRRIYLAGLTVFLAASLGSATAGGIAALVAFRLLQGAGAGAMMPLTLSLIVTAFPPKERGLAIGIWGGVSGLGLIAGPLLGGLLVQGDNWRWIFLVNLPLGALAIAFALLFVRESRDESAPPTMDWLGLALAVGGLLPLMYGLMRAPAAGWGDPLVVASLAGGAALLALFVRVQRRVRHPLLDLSLFSNRSFVAACLSAFLFSAAVFGSQPFASLLMQNTWGFTPLQGGAAFVPATILVALMMVAAGWLGPRLGKRLNLAIMAGALAVCLSNLFLLPMDATSTYWDSLLPAFVVRGFGIGLFFTATTIVTMAALPDEKSGVGAGVLILARQLGNPFGVAMLGTAYLEYLHHALPVAGPDGAGRAAMLAAAESFAPAVLPAQAAALTGVIVEGFVVIAWAVAALAALATLAALAIRYRPPEAAPAPSGRTGAATAAGAPPLQQGSA